jgi:DNA-binding LacI/PurR family transcriptional regulator
VISRAISLIARDIKNPVLATAMDTSSHSAAKQPARRLRMIDIAKAAGVSRAAVSHVLNGGRGTSIRLSEETAARIRRVADELRFHPSHAARQLAGKRSGLIGVLAKTWLQTEASALAWSSRVASSRQLKVLAWEMADENEANWHPEALDRFVDECLAWNIEGLVFVAFKYDALWPQVAKALARLPRVVSVVGDPGVRGGYTVLTDAADGVRQCVEHLHRQGRRKIVQLLENCDAQIDRQRHDAFLAANREFYGSVRKDQVHLARERCGRQEYDKLLPVCREIVVERKADAVLLDSDFDAPAFMRACAKLGCRVPDDVALVGWGNEAIGWGVLPLLTTVDFNFHEIIEKALDLLGDLVERPAARRPRSIVVKPKLIVQETA